MLINLKAMVVVISIAIVVFALAKPLCLRYMTAEDFARRRNVWLILTLTAFTSPSFWVYVAVALPVVLWAARKDSNPIALYLLVLLIVPPTIKFEIPIVGINKLFELTHLRLLSFALLLPAAWRIVTQPADGARGRFAAMDALILAFGALQLILLAPHQSTTHSLRQAFLFGLDVLLLYYVASRSSTSVRRVEEAMASFCLACGIFAPLAMFESAKGWLLYEGLGSHWGAPLDFLFLMRDNTLRASVSAGQAIPLGHLFAIGFGFVLYLGAQLESRRLAALLAIWMWIGLLAAYSRGPWVVAVAIFFAFLAFGPSALTRLSRAAVIASLGAVLVLASPIGGRVIDNLPFVGTVDAENVTYRQQLLEVSFVLIMARPLFGDPFYVDQLEVLRQGQGIIDMLNYMATIALGSGLVGLSLCLAFFFVAIAKAYRLARATSGADPAPVLLGATLLACLLGLLLAMAIGGYGPSVQCTAYAIAGFAAGLWRPGRSSVPVRLDRAAVPPAAAGRGMRSNRTAR